MTPQWQRALTGGSSVWISEEEDEEAEEEEGNATTRGPPTMSPEEEALAKAEAEAEAEKERLAEEEEDDLLDSQVASRNQTDEATTEATSGGNATNMTEEADGEYDESGEDVEEEEGEGDDTAVPMSPLEAKEAENEELRKEVKRLKDELNGEVSNETSDGANNTNKTISSRTQGQVLVPTVLPAKGKAKRMTPAEARAASECQWTQWGEWSSCHDEFSDGMRMRRERRTREVVTPSADGSMCLGTSEARMCLEEQKLGWILPSVPKVPCVPVIR